MLAWNPNGSIEKFDSDPYPYVPEGVVNEEGFFIPGPGTPIHVYEEYVSIVRRYKELMGVANKNTPRAKQLIETIEDINRKIGATAESFHQKLGDQLEPMLSEARQAGDLASYYAALELLAIRTLAAAVTNKALVKDGNAIKFGERIVYVLKRHPTLEVFIKYQIFTKCPYAIPMYPRRLESMPAAAFRSSVLGFKPNPTAAVGASELEKLEDLSSYLERMRRMMHYYAAIMNCAPPAGVQNPLGIQQAWSWLVRFISLPRTEISLWILESVVLLCSRRLFFAYGSQYEKLAAAIQEFVTPPSSGPQWFDSDPWITVIKLSLRKPTAFPPIQHTPDREFIMQKISETSIPEIAGHPLSARDMDLTFEMIGMIDSYIESHDDDFIEDLLQSKANWDKLVEHQSTLESQGNFAKDGPSIQERLKAIRRPIAYPNGDSYQDNSQGGSIQEMWGDQDNNTPSGSYQDYHSSYQDHGYHSDVYYDNSSESTNISYNVGNYNRGNRRGGDYNEYSNYRQNPNSNYQSQKSDYNQQYNQEYSGNNIRGSYRGRQSQPYNSRQVNHDYHPRSHQDRNYGNESKQSNIYGDNQYRNRGNRGRYEASYQNGSSNSSWKDDNEHQVPHNKRNGYQKDASSSNSNQFESSKSVYSESNRGHGNYNPRGNRGRDRGSTSDRGSRRGGGSSESGGSNQQQSNPNYSSNRSHSGRGSFQHSNRRGNPRGNSRGSYRGSPN